MLKLAAICGVFAMFFGVARAAENVTIPSGDITLAASFYPAPGAGKHPVVILLAGSGKAVRDNVPFTTLETVFTAAGISVLAYDKRGSGASGGTYDDNTPLATLAGDGLAAVHYAQSRSDVDAKRVGVWGISQGGWVAPLMATMSPDVAFVIAVSGPGMSIAEQAIYLRGTQMLAQGFSAQDVAEETAYRRVVWAYLGTGLGREAAQAALDAVKTRPWFVKLGLSPTLGTPDSLDPASRQFFRDAATYDPLAVAQAVRVPILSIFGGKDTIAPASLSIQNFMQAYARGGNAKAAFRLFPDAGHGLQVVTTPVECHECSEREMMQTKRWNAAPGFFSTMTDWLRGVLAS
jgi:uncharacterized protein